MSIIRTGLVASKVESKHGWAHGSTHFDDAADTHDSREESEYRDEHKKADITVCAAHDVFVLCLVSLVVNIARDRVILIGQVRPLT